MSKVVQHSWKNGGDDSKKPTVTIEDNGRVTIISDGDTDADGSPRVAEIDPSCGQGETSLRRSNGWKGEWMYADSEVIPFFVLPLNWCKVTGLSWHLGDVARLSWKNYSVYAIFADEGPTTLLGEASVCAIEALGGNPWNSAKTRIVTGIPHGVKYEVIPNSADLDRTVDFESIQKYGRELFGVEENPAKIPEDPPLMRGDRGEEVVELQKALNKAINAGLETDGVFGKLTEAAVKEAQKRLGQPVTGKASKSFIKALPTIPEPDRPDKTKEGQKLLWIPFATKVEAIATPWTYAKGYPEGAIVHFTAGSDAQSSLSYLREMGYPCLVIDKKGKIFQPFPLNKAGAHCGTEHHRYCVGIEIDASGRCDKLANGTYKTWYGRILTEDKIRYSKKNANIQEGYYEKYTPEQEEALTNLLIWMYKNNPGVFTFDKVFGHDEVSPGRKNDPGAALSMTMPEFRALLKKKANE